MSEALRLADALELPMHESVYYRHAAAAELRRLHSEHTELGQAIKRAIERINELEAELHEQARVNGMGGEREARLMAVNSELVAALIKIEWSNNTEWQRDRARAALAKTGDNK